MAASNEKIETAPTRVRGLIARRGNSLLHGIERNGAGATFCPCTAALNQHDLTFVDF
jgi:hypothetical protein